MTDYPELDTILNAIEIAKQSDTQRVELSRNLFLLDLEDIEHDDPDLGFLIRACAVASHFDESTIGVLREDNEGVETNAALLEDLLSYPFVLEHEDSGYTLHENTRAILLEEWHKPDNIAEFKKIKNRLVHYYRQSYQTAQNEDDSGLRYLNRILEIVPSDVEALIARSSIYFQRQDFVFAQNDLSKLVKLLPRSGQIYFIRGRIYFENKQVEKAIAHFDLAIHFEPTNKDYFVWRAMAHLSLNKSDKTRQDLQSAIAIEPSAEAYYLLSQVFYNQNMLAEAISALNRSISIDPNNIQTYIWLRRIYRDLKDNVSALEVTNKALQLAPQNGMLLYSRGRIYFDLGDFKSAINDFEQAIKHDYIDEYIFSQLIDALQQIGEDQRAIETTLNAQNVFPSNKNFTTRLFWMYFQLERWEDALNLVNYRIQEDKTNADLYLQRANVLISTQKYQEALSDLTRSIELVDGEEQYYLRSVAYYHVGEYLQALKDAETALQIAKNLGDSIKRLLIQIYSVVDQQIVQLRSDGQLEEALEVALKYCQLSNTTNSYLWLRRLYRDLRQNDKALEVNTQAIENSPDNGELYYMRGRIHNDNGDYASALYDWTQAVELGYKADTLYLDQMQLFYNLELFNKALDAINLLLNSAENNDSKALYYEWRGKIYRRTGNYYESRTDFENAINFKRLNPDIIIRLAHVYLGLLQPDKALSILTTPQMPQMYFNHEYLITKSEYALGHYKTVISRLMDDQSIETNEASQLLLSSALIGDANYIDSKKMLERMLESDNVDTSEVLFWLGIVGFVKSKTTNRLEQALELSQLTTSNRIECTGRIELLLGNMTKAIDFYHKRVKHLDTSSRYDSISNEIYSLRLLQQIFSHDTSIAISKALDELTNIYNEDDK